MLSLFRRAREGGRVDEGDASYRGVEKREGGEGGVLNDCRAYAFALTMGVCFLQRDLQLLTDTSGASGHQKLRVCDVCGAYLSVLDSDRRLADHFGGKVGIVDGSGCPPCAQYMFHRCTWGIMS
jgi:hypothetical protein